jgi:hypothetical protein
VKIIRLLKRDLSQGLIKKLYCYLFVMVVIFVSSYQISEVIDLYKGDGGEFGTVSFWDYLFLNMNGMEPYTFSYDSGFSVPMVWFCIALGFHYIIAYYPEKDLNEYGAQILMSSKSRTGWWISKCGWCFVSVIVYFVFILASVGLVTMCFEGSLSFDFELKASTFFIDDNFKYVFKDDMILAAIILPMLTMFALGMLQMLLSFLLSSIISFAVICTIYVLSAYYTIWWLPGSYTMLHRSNFVTSDGLSPYSGLVIAGVIVFISFMGGYLYITNKDILK